MPDSWLKSPDPAINAAALSNLVDQRLAQQSPPPLDGPSLAQEMWQAQFGQAVETGLPSVKDCDIVPRDYQIKWQNPLLGPLNAFLRRLINAEIRRYLLPALEQQSVLNRQFAETLATLQAENQTLRAHLAAQTDSAEGSNHSD